MERVFASAGVVLESCDTVNKDNERFIISINGKRLQLDAFSNRIDGAWLVVKELK
jgi:hypothetical protein